MVTAPWARQRTPEGCVSLQGQEIQWRERQNPVNPRGQQMRNLVWCSVDALEATSDLSPHRVLKCESGDTSPWALLRHSRRPAGGHRVSRCSYPPKTWPRSSHQAQLCRPAPVLQIQNSWEHKSCTTKSITLRFNYRKGYLNGRMC